MLSWPGRGSVTTPGPQGSWSWLARPRRGSVSGSGNHRWPSRLVVLAGARLDAKSVIGRTISLLELLRAVDGQALQVGGLKMTAGRRLRSPGRPGRLLMPPNRRSVVCPRWSSGGRAEEHRKKVRPQKSRVGRREPSHSGQRATGSRRAPLGSLHPRLRSAAHKAKGAKLRLLRPAQRLCCPGRSFWTCATRTVAASHKTK